MRMLKRIAALLLAILSLVLFCFGAMPVSAADVSEIQRTAAELYTDETYSEPLLTDTEITVSGVLPAHAVVKGYPVSYSIDGMKTLAAYDLTIFEEDGETIYEPDGRAVQVTFTMPELADAENKSLAVYHIGEEGAEEEIAEISAEAGSVSFEAEHFSVYVISEHEGLTPEVQRVEFHFLTEGTIPEGGEGSAVFQSQPFEFRTKGHQGDGLMKQTSQILLDGETLEMIENPPNHTRADGSLAYFYGWYIITPEEEQPADGNTLLYQWMADPEEIAFEQPITIADDGWTMNGISHDLKPDADGCTHVYLAPLFSDYHFLNFHMRMRGTESDTDTLLTRSLLAFGNDHEVEARIGNITAPSPDVNHLVFIGWEYYSAEDDEWLRKLTVDNSGAEIVSPDGKDGYYITLKEADMDEDNNIDLYPLFVEARWLSLNTILDGATYAAPQYLLTNDEGLGTSVSQLPVSKRNGYQFAGWYSAPASDPNAVMIADATGRIVPGPVNFRDDPQRVYEVADGELRAYKMDPDATDTKIQLYAHWVEEPDSQYTVIVWAQKITDDKDAAKADRTYDYVTSKEIESRSGRTLAQILSSNELRPFLSYNSTSPDKMKLVQKGFELRSDSPVMSTATVSGDRKTVINIYYDRDLITLNYYVYDTDGFEALPDTDVSTSPQYGAVGDQMVRLTRRELTNQTLWSPEYTYTPTDAANGTQYGVVNGQYVELTKQTRTVDSYYWTYTVPSMFGGSTVNNLANNADKNFYFANRSASGYTVDNPPPPEDTTKYYARVNGWLGLGYDFYELTRNTTTTTETYWTTPDGTEHTDTRYTRSNGGSNYTGNRYSESNGVFRRTADENVTPLYGLDDNGNYVKLTKSTGSVYKWYYTEQTDNGPVEKEYTRTRYKSVSGNNAWRLHRQFQGLYGQTLVSNGYKWPEDHYWYANGGNNGTTSGSRTTFLDAFLPPEVVQTKEYYGSAVDGNVKIRFYKEELTSGNYPSEATNTVYAGSGTFSITDKYTGFTAAQYRVNGGAWQNLKKEDKDTNGVYAKVDYRSGLDIRFSRDPYILDFDINYPDKTDRTFEYGTELESIDSETLLFEESLSKFGPDGAKYHDLKNNAPDHYTFAGWYEDKAGTVPFNFDATMPAGNKILYAKWEPEEFLVKIDPNGAEIDHINHNVQDYLEQIYDNEPIPADSEPIPPFNPARYIGYDTDHSTYFHIDYDEEISKYEDLTPPKYIPISDVTAEGLEPDHVFYYVNIQHDEDAEGRSLPNDLHNALFLTEDEVRSYYDFHMAVLKEYKKKDHKKYEKARDDLDFELWKHLYVSTQKYGRISEVSDANTAYELREWYQVQEDGSVSAVQYDFSAPVKEDVTLRAVWQLNGGYTIAYVPLYRIGDVDINGEMDQWTDPDIRSGLAINNNYAEKASATVLRQPVDLTANGDPIRDREYIFRGWQVVMSRDGNYIPMEPGKYYQPGEQFTIETKYASSDNIIIMQAVYERQDNAYRRPEVANLKLDASESSGGYISELNNNAAMTGNTPIAWTSWYDSESVGNAAAVPEENQLWFGDMQSNAAVHLYQYATDDKYKSEPWPSGSYFANRNGDMLLGFDTIENEGDFIADYAADSVISVQRQDAVTLYAVWEPTVYINFRNETGKPVTFALNAEDTQTLYVVNEAVSVYDREKVQDLSNITVEPNETLRLAIPYGAEKNITINGKNELGVGYVLETFSEIPEGAENPPPEHEHLFTDNGAEFEYTEQLIKNQKGMTIVFKQEKRECALILDDPKPPLGRDTGTHEFDYNELELPTDFELRETRAKIGYIFTGWSWEKGDTEPDFVVNDTTIQHLNLKELFAAAPPDDVHYETLQDTHQKVAYLYAVWEINKKADIVDIYKDVPAPGNQNQDFTFTLNLKFDYSVNNGTQKHFKDSAEITLRHGEHIRIEHLNSTSPTYNYSKVTFYNADGSLNTEKQPINIGLVSDVNGSLSITGYEMSVTEDAAQYYDTVSEVLDHTAQNGYPLNSGNQYKIYWTDPNTGGTAVFTNTRKTTDFTVEKVAVDPENKYPGREYRFRAELLDQDPDYDYTLPDSEFALHTGEKYKFEGIPVGANLKITELDSGDYKTVILAENGTDDTDTDARSYTCTVPENGESVTFTNTLKDIKVEIYSWDLETNERFTSTSYRISGVDGALYPAAGSGLIYAKDPMYYGTYTVEQTWCTDTYQQIAEPITITISDDSGDNPVSVDHDATVRIEDGIYKIYILNQKKTVAPTGVTQNTAAAAMLAVLSGTLCAVCVMLNRRRREVDSDDML